MLNENIKTALNLLKDEGFEAYIVGGALRDALLNMPIHDIDITTNATPPQIQEVFKEYKCLDIGIKHGTITVFINSEKIEITTFRIDGKYIKNRKPKNIIFTPSLKEDLKRRDFTINALCYDTEKGIIDYFNGREDIDNKIIRCIGNPTTRFNEDALRILRAIRFKAQLNFTIEEATNKAIYQNKDLLKNISIERINDELFKILQFENGINIIKEYEEIFKVRYLQLNPKNIKGNFYVKLSVLLKNCPINNLALSNKTIKKIQFINNNIDKAFSTKYEIKKALQINEEAFTDLLTNKNQITNNLYKEIIKNNEPYLIKDLAINGNDLKDKVKINEISIYLNKALDIIQKDPTKNNKTYLLNNVF